MWPQGQIAQKLCHIGMHLYFCILNIRQDKFKTDTDEGEQPYPAEHRHCRKKIYRDA